MQVNNKYNSIDFFKFVMAFLVVGIHTGLVDSFEAEIVRKAVFQVLNLGVPFFFLASGYLLASKMQWPFGSKEDRGVLKHHLKKVILLYLIWMTVYLPITVITCVKNGLYWAEGVFLIVKGYILTGELECAFHFWYLLSTIYAIIIIIVLMKLRISFSWIIFVSFLASILGAVLQILPGYEKELPTALNVLRFFMLAGFVNNRIMNGLIYIPIGMLMYRYRFDRRIGLIMFAVTFAFGLFVDNQVLTLYLLIASSVGLFAFISNLEFKDSPHWALLRNMSTYIYLIHMYMWLFFYSIFYGQESYGFVCFVATSILSLIFAYLFVGVKKIVAVNTSIIVEEHESISK